MTTWTSWPLPEVLLLRMSVYTQHTHTTPIFMCNVQRAFYGIRCIASKKLVSSTRATFLIIYRYFRTHTHTQLLQQVGRCLVRLLTLSETRFFFLTWLLFRFLWHHKLQNIFTKTTAKQPRRDGSITKLPYFSWNINNPKNSNEIFVIFCVWCLHLTRQSQANDHRISVVLVYLLEKLKKYFCYFVC